VIFLSFVMISAPSTALGPTEPIRQLPGHRLSPQHNPRSTGLVLASVAIGVADGNLKKQLRYNFRHA
jgi:hypothetical protein